MADMMNLAILQDGEAEQQNKNVVKSLYEALAAKDVETVYRLLAPDLEWWFHGPPSHQHLMHLLTGSSSSSDFTFKPLSIVSFVSTVVVEGFNKDCNVSWVHAWTINDGILTHVREYLNTSVTVTRIADGGSRKNTVPSRDFASVGCQSVWESKLSNNESVPGLLLAL